MKLGRYLVGEDLNEWALTEISPSETYGKFISPGGKFFWRTLSEVPFVEALDAPGKFCGECALLRTLRADQMNAPSDFLCGLTSEELFVEEGKVLRGKRCPKEGEE